jgi:hypothetical protein
MSNNPHENAWAEFKQITQFTYIQLCDAIHKKQTGEIKDAETQRMMMSKLMYSIDDLERKHGITSSQIITP